MSSQPKCEQILISSKNLLSINWQRMSQTSSRTLRKSFRNHFRALPKTSKIKLMAFSTRYYPLTRSRWTSWSTAFSQWEMSLIAQFKLNQMELPRISSHSKRRLIKCARILSICQIRYLVRAVKWRCKRNLWRRGSKIILWNLELILIKIWILKLKRFNNTLKNTLRY